MAMSLTIEEFNALLTSEEKTSPLLVTLRKLTRIEDPKDITALDAEPLQNWAGWDGW